MSGPFGYVFDASPLSISLVEKARAYAAGTGSCTHRAVWRRAPRHATGAGPRFLVRVDDFPRWDIGIDGFEEFDAILADAGVPYVLGVIPSPAIDPSAIDETTERAWTAEERSVLEELTPRVELAIHGWNHRRRGGPVASEIVGLPADELSRRVERGVDRLQAMGTAVRSYIPPYNGVDSAALEVLAGRFEVVFGGPESVRWLGCLPGPCRLATTWYLPSYPPAYGNAADVIPFAKEVKNRRLPLLVPLTLHWSWEREDGFAAVRRLAEVIAPRTVSLGDWLDGRAWDESSNGSGAAHGAGRSRENA